MNNERFGCSTKKMKPKPKEVSCETCRKCGETICGNDTEHLRCWENNSG